MLKVNREFIKDDQNYETYNYECELDKTLLLSILLDVYKKRKDNIYE